MESKLTIILLQYFEKKNQTIEKIYNKLKINTQYEFFCLGPDEINNKKYIEKIKNEINPKIIICPIKGIKEIKYVINLWNSIDYIHLTGSGVESFKKFISNLRKKKYKTYKYKRCIFSIFSRMVYFFQFIFRKKNTIFFAKIKEKRMD